MCLAGRTSLRPDWSCCCRALLWQIFRDAPAETISVRKRIILSHSRIFEDVQRAEARAEKKAANAARKAANAARKEETPAIQNQAASTTLGDLDALAELKAKMQKGE